MISDTWEFVVGSNHPAGDPVSAGSDRTTIDSRPGASGEGHEGASSERAGGAHVAVTEPWVDRSQLLQTVLAGVVPSFLGVVAYAIVREGYVGFYQPYGVAPEEVGLTNVNMLSSVFRPLVTWFVLFPGRTLVNLLQALLTVGLFVASWRLLLHLLRRRSRQIDNMASHHPVLLGSSAILTLVMLLYIWALPRDTDYAGKHLQMGREVRASELAILSIQAHPAQVTWITAESRPGVAPI